jgi:serine/threonine-protein kinase
MAPEQMMSSKDVDARADIWALGIILYELLAGAPPFVAETMPEIVFMVTQRDPPPLATKRPDLPVALADIVARCLIRDPTQRYANVARLASALAPFGPPRSEISVERIVRVLGASAPPPPEGSGRQVPKQATSSTWASSQPGARTQSKARAAILVGALVALFGVGVGWRLLRSPAQPARSEEPATTAAAPPTSAPEASAAPTGAPVPAPPSPTAILAPAPVTPEPLPVKSAKPAVTTPVAVARPTPAKPRPAPAPVESAAEPRPAQNRGLNMGMKE